MPDIYKQPDGSFWVGDKDTGLQQVASTLAEAQRISADMTRSNAASQPDFASRYVDSIISGVEAGVAGTVEPDVPREAFARLGERVFGKPLDPDLWNRLPAPLKAIMNTSLRIGSAASIPYSLTVGPIAHEFGYQVKEHLPENRFISPEAAGTATELAANLAIPMSANRLSQIPIAGKPLSFAANPLQHMQQPGVVTQTLKKMKEGQTENIAAARVAAREPLSEKAQNLRVARQTTNTAEAKLQQAEAIQAGAAATPGTPRFEPFPPREVPLPSAKTPAELSLVKEATGQRFKTAFEQQAEKLYAQSRANYEPLTTSAEGLTRVSEESVGAISDAVNTVTADMRATPGVVKRVGGKLAPPPAEGAEAGGVLAEMMSSTLASPKLSDKAKADIQSVLNPNAAEPPTLGAVVEARQAVREASRKASSSGNWAGRNLLKGFEDQLTGVLESNGSSDFLNSLHVADQFHKQISKQVGYGSLLQRVYKSAEPEQILAKFWLPEGSSPNLSMIDRGKQVIQKADPEGWKQLTDLAQQDFITKAVDPKNGLVDSGRWATNWQKFQSTFQRALEPEEFRGLKVLSEEIQAFNRGEARYKEAKALWDNLQAARRKTETAHGGLLAANRGEAYAETALRKAAAKAQAGIETLKGNPVQLGGGRSSNVNFSTLIALANFGQAAQALLTSPHFAAMQAIQGVMWLTVGNPHWLLQRIADPRTANFFSQLDKLRSNTGTMLERSRFIGVLAKTANEVAPPPEAPQ